MSTTSATRSLLDLTLAAAVRDQQTATPEGARVTGLIDGMRIRPLTTHADLRGSVLELYDPRWGWHDEPLLFVYSFTIRPGIVKGWNLHREHEDRYALLQGELEIVLFDPRPDSSTVRIGKSRVTRRPGKSAPGSTWPMRVVRGLRRFDTGSPQDCRNSE